MKDFCYFFCNSSKSLKFGVGENSLLLDKNNSHFSPIVSLLNECNPAKIIVANLDPKAFLLFIRALFHSELRTVNLSVYLDLSSQNYEDYIYPISKTFGMHALCQRRSSRGRWYHLVFSINIQKERLTSTVDFFVITDGKNQACLMRCIESIAVQGADCNIFIIAPRQFAGSNFMRKYPRCQLVPDDEIYTQDTRFPLAKKKNLAFSKSKAEIIVLVHDRISFSPDWLRKMKLNMPKFDFYTCKIWAGNKRYLDKFAVSFKGYINHKKLHYYLTYAEDNANQVIDGGFFVFNRYSLRNCQLDENLNWGEMEDLAFVLKQKLDCRVISFDQENLVYSIDANHFSMELNSLTSYCYRVWLRRFFGFPLVMAVAYIKRRLKKVRRKVKH